MSQICQEQRVIPVSLTTLEWLAVSAALATVARKKMTIQDPSEQEVHSRELDQEILKKISSALSNKNETPSL